MNEILDQALAGVSKDFRRRLIQKYLELKRNVAEGRSETAGLCAGKFCEIVIRLLQKRIIGTFIPFGSKIGNFADECRKIITSSKPPSVTDSERVILPRALVFLYTIRNTRGIGHIGGDVDPNAIDTAVIARVADWIVCELIRIHHGLSLEEAQDIIDGIAAKALPDVWQVGEKRRILREGLKTPDQALLLLYSVPRGIVLVEDLLEWIEYSNPSTFKSNVLRPLHTKRMIEWDVENNILTISPKGVAHVESNIL